MRCVSSNASINVIREIIFFASCCILTIRFHDMECTYRYAGAVPRYTVLKRQGYLVLILEKDLVFYKVDDDKKLVTVYAVVDQRQDYLSIIRGL